MAVGRLPLLSLLLLACLGLSSAWKLWENNGETSEEWMDTWGLTDGPGGRYGHSIVMSHNDTQMILFGGRGNNTRREHIPKTYEIVRQNGSLDFVSYDEMPVLDCQYNVLNNISDNSSSTCDLSIETGVYFNDVWLYDLNCTRTLDGPCEDDGWRVLNAGARNGGCKYYLGTELCTTPSERWGHAAAMFADGTMIIYGGYSHLCGDYCDDVWSFDLRDNTWMEIYTAGHFSDEEGPGKRWRFSIGYDGYKMLIFGGHRLWHGFASDNSEANAWESRDVLPRGGYLGDLWIYNKTQLDPETQVPIDSSDYGNFSSPPALQTCYDDPGMAWSERNDITCETSWPTARAGHVAVWDEDLGGMFVHGGYTTYFPYMSTTGAGSDAGTGSLSSTGFRPYADYPFFLDDLWFFNYSSGYWNEIVYNSTFNPSARMDHVVVKVDSLLLLFGGYYSNHHYGDTWQFNTTTNRWLERTSFVTAKYPENCTDDLDHIRDKNCTRLLWPKELERDSSSSTEYEVLGFAEQDYYYPDAAFGHYYGIMNRGEDPSGVLSQFPRSNAEEGEPMAPYAATAPRQYVRPFVYQFNSTHNATLYEWCTSVFGEPTRDTATDGLFGRASESIFIAQPRRQAPGWDGCRDRLDGREDLAQELMWEQPGHRSAMKAVYSTTHQKLLVYGGLGYTDLYLPVSDLTIETRALDELWQLAVSACPSNCSNAGECHYGYCRCDDGYYGLDCSNTSCPGSFCYYDEYTNEQVCSHCCMGGWTHQDTDTYGSAGEVVSKLACSADIPGESHGICDGFGTCQCAPPFLGDDCSMKDCKHNCSFNGMCSVEFPVSRCICNEGYYGEYCQFQECLNNCSYPHGNCNSTTGVCACEMMYNPYVRSREWYAWGGEDCSWITAFAAAPRSCALPSLFALVAVVGVTILLFLAPPAA